MEASDWKAAVSWVPEDPARLAWREGSGGPSDVVLLRAKKERQGPKTIVFAAISGSVVLANMAYLMQVVEPTEARAETLLQQGACLKSQRAVLSLADKAHASFERSFEALQDVDGKFVWKSMKDLPMLTGMLQDSLHGRTQEGRKRQRPAEQQAGRQAAADGAQENKTRSTPATAMKPESDGDASARLFHYYSSGRFETQLQARDTAIESSLKGLDAEELDVGPLKELLQHPELHQDLHNQASKLVDEVEEAEEASVAEVLDQMRRPKTVEQLKAKLERRRGSLGQAQAAALQDSTDTELLDEVKSLEEEVAELGAEIQRREEHAGFDARGLAAAVRTLLEDEQKLQARRSRFAAQLRDGVDLAKGYLAREELAAE